MDQIVRQLMQVQNEKLELLQKVLASTQKQQQYIADDDVDSLILEIDNRQKLLENIVSLNETAEALKPKAQGISVDKSFLNLDLEVKKVYQSIEELNAQNNKDAQIKLNEYRTSIAETRKIKKGFQSYVPEYIMQDGMYIDKKK